MPVRRYTLYFSSLGLLFLLALSVLAVQGSRATAATKTTFTNPVYPHNFPDPYILQVGKTYFAYGTGTCTRNLQVMHSLDLVHWSPAREALRSVPKWSDANCSSFFQNRMVWASEVLHRSDGKYLIYFAAHLAGTSHQCVSYAVSSSPLGPFTDSSKKPFVCQQTLGGTIDPDVFRDGNGKLYLLWKNDGNCCGLKTYIFIQGLDATGTKLVGRQAKLIHNDAAWEVPLIEAPSMWKHGGRYYLFYSASSFDTPSYAVGYATCQSVYGPCKDARENPILHSRCTAVGPGHQALFLDARGQTWMAYHAWEPHHVGDSPGAPGRRLWIDRVDWKNGKPVVHGPTCTSQPVPSTRK
jgi:beta-xylosidase